MILFILASLLFAHRRMLRYLRFLQQDSYLTGRYIQWLWKERAFDRRGTVCVVSALLLSIWNPTYSWTLGGVALLSIALLETNPFKEGKIRLNMTARAKRILQTAYGLFLLFQFFAILAAGPFFWLSQIVLIQLIPFLLVIAVRILSFDEKRRQKRYLHKAKIKFRQTNPYTIGITGSYGKTSTKDALGHLLQITLGSVYWPSKGINTEMGITRDIRERLQRGTQYAVIEMAAYGRGSIKKLTELTPPSAAIITCVGMAHLDRFGSRETIYQAKSELAQALPEDGILVCNGDDAGARRMAADCPKKTTLLYGLSNDARDLDCWMIPSSASPEGTTFSLLWKGKTYYGTTPLLGNTALLNIAGAFTMACALGADPTFAAAACAALKPVENRLQLTNEQDALFIRDAYNSNPQGFLAALDVLQALPAKKRLLMTPGMIEFSTLQEELHEKIGRRAAEVCDFTILVGSTNRESLAKGMLAGGMSKQNIIVSESREEAFKELYARLEKGDAVLIENDLPDLFEMQERF